MPSIIIIVYTCTVGRFFVFFFIFCLYLVINFTSDRVSFRFVFDDTSVEISVPLVH